MTATLDEAQLRQWIGRKRVQKDQIDSRQASLLAATLTPERAAPQPGDPLPFGWHWAFFLEAPRIDRLGIDGHAALGDFLPPVDLPTRMWAGTRLTFHQPIRVGTSLQRESQVSDVRRKTGRTGELCFVTVTHRILDDESLLLEEDHDIVYRSALQQRQRPDSSAHGAEDGATDRSTATASVAAELGTTDAADTSGFDETASFMPTSVLLFRYSALTFNGHRIHYDLDFCRNVEGYRGLVVHAPLTSTLMLGLAESFYAGTDSRIATFRQRSLSALFHDEPVTLGLKARAAGCTIEARGADGRVAASAELTIR